MATKTRRLNTPASFASLLSFLSLSLAMLLTAGASMSGQAMPDRRDNDATRQEIVEMDRFLDRHPEIAEQLRKDPSLVNNREFVDHHPALHEYLQKHPDVREEFSERPNAFMRQEDRYDRQSDQRYDRDDRRSGDRFDDRRSGDRDEITRRQLGDLDRFLDRHPELAEQLRKDPSLINNRQFVANHPALNEYLENHRELHEEFSRNPDAFMRHEERYDRREEERERTYPVSDRDHPYSDSRGEMSNFGAFLGGHSTVATELSRDPSLANNKEYLATHPELNDYLKAHPAISQQLAENPQQVMSSNWVQQGGTSTSKTTPPPKGKPNPNQ
jgi:hypothetical protein